MRALRGNEGIGDFHMEAEVTCQSRTFLFVYSRHISSAQKYLHPLQPDLSDVPGHKSDQVEIDQMGLPDPECSQYSLFIAGFWRNDKHGKLRQ